jgi:CubicO group peptidase (beta-lactamase class C family)
MQTTVVTQGTVDPAFEHVHDAFAHNWLEHDEVGASLCVYVDGKPVVDLWGGWADEARTREWEKDTIVCVWSTTKGITATCAHRLADQGRLDLDAPVAKYWPEFAQAGKGDIPVNYLLSHRAGLPAISEPLPLGAAYDWELMTGALARQEPWWTPGEKHGYHAFTYGWLVGEVVRRVSGMSIGQYWRKEIAEPLGLDFYIGLPADQHGRVAETISAEMPTDPDHFLFKMLADPDSMAFRVLANPPDLFVPGVANTPEWRSAEIPGAGGQGNGRSVARHYAALARGGELDGFRVLSPEAIERATVVQASGPDEVMHLPLEPALGYVVSGGAMAMGPNPRSFGHSGAGGSLGFADPDAKIGFGYAMNRAIQPPNLVDPRWTPMIDAVYACL